VVLTNARGRLTRSMAAALRLSCGVESYEDVRGETSPLTASEVAELTGRYDNYQWLEITRRGDRALFGPWLPWWGRWLPLRRNIVRYGTDDYGVTGIPGMEEPVRFHVVRAADGSINHFVMMARAFKRRR